jgi:hypothetical protein
MRTVVEIEAAIDTVATMLADFYVAPPIVTIGGQIPSRTYTCNVKYTRISFFKSDLLRLGNFFVTRLGESRYFS